MTVCKKKTRVVVVVVVVLRRQRNGNLSFTANTSSRTYLDILILQRFYIESNRWNGLYGFIALVLQSVQDGGLAGIIETQNQDPYLL